MSLSYVTAPYAIRVKSAEDVLAKVAVMRAYNAAHGTDSNNQFTEVFMVRAAARRATPRALLCAQAHARARSQVKAQAGGNKVSSVIDIPEGAGWTVDTRFHPAPYATEVMLHCRWLVTNFTDKNEDCDSRRTIRALGGVLCMSVYMACERLAAAGDDLLADSSALEALAEKAPKRELRSRANWASVLC